MTETKTKINIWQDGLEPSWRYSVEGTYSVVAGFSNEHEAENDATDRYGVLSITWAAPLEKRLLTVTETVKRSPLGNDGVCATAPLQSESSTIPPVCRILHVEVDLLPLLRDSVEQAQRRLRNAISNDYGTESLLPDEVAAVKGYRRVRLERVCDLLAQIAA